MARHRSIAFLAGLALLLALCGTAVAKKAEEKIEDEGGYSGRFGVAA